MKKLLRKEKKQKIFYIKLWSKNELSHRISLRKHDFVPEFSPILGTNSGLAGFSMQVFSKSQSNPLTLECQMKDMISFFQIPCKMPMVHNLHSIFIHHSLFSFFLSGGENFPENFLELKHGTKNQKAESNSIMHCLVFCFFLLWTCHSDLRGSRVNKPLNFSPQENIHSFFELWKQGKFALDNLWSCKMRNPGPEKRYSTWKGSFDSINQSKVPNPGGEL